MSFLRINGWAIPVKDVSLDVKEIGARGTSHAGNPLTDIRTTKRIIKGRTGPLTEMQAEAFKGVIRGAGDHWTFDNTAYSDKGLGTDSTDGIAYEQRVADDGDDILYWTNLGNFAAGAKYGTHCIVAHDNDVVNLLTKDSSDAENAPTGFTVYNGSTLSGDTSNYINGSKSLKCVTSGGGSEGFDVDAISCSASTEYALSIYLKSESDTSVYVDMYDDIGLRSSYNPDLKANKWQRVIRKASTNIGATQMYLRVRTSDAVTLYADRVQFELTDTGKGGSFAFGTPWIVGGAPGATRTGGEVQYSNMSILNNAQDVSISFWSPNRYLHMYGGTDYTLRLTDNGAGSVGDEAFAITQVHGPYAQSAKYIIDGSDYNTLSGTVDHADSLNYHICYVLRRNPETGEYRGYLYNDGTLLDSTAGTANAPTWSNITEMILNSAAANGAYDDLIITPYAMTSAQVAALYAMDKAWPTMPSFYVDGDILPDDELTTMFQGKVTGVKFLQAGDSSWRNNWQEVEFELMEV